MKDRTIILSGAGGRLATVQPGVASWHYIHWIDAREFSAWYLAGVKLDSHQVAEIIGVKQATVNTWCWAGKVPGAIKPGHDWLIPREALEKLERGPSRWDKQS